MYDKEKLNAGLNQLTGLDYEAAARRFKATNKDFFGVIQLESGFFAEVAALALGQNANELKALSLREYFNICNEVQRFLNSDSEENPTVSN